MLAFLFAISLSLKASAQATTSCAIQTRTQAYYASAAGSTYVTEHFAQAFPTGLSVGCSTGRTLRLTAATAVANFLPSPAGTTEVLNASYLNPLKLSSGGTNTYGSNFAGQVVALTLSVGFDLADANFSSADVQLKDALIITGPFAGKSVAFVLTQANLALGGCTSQYTVDQLTTIVTAINESSEAGKTGDLLTCTGACSIPVPNVVAPVAYCLGTTSTLLGANVTAATGATINIYTTAAGSTPLPDFQPSTTAISSTTYYISQTIGTCESNRVPVVVSIVPKPNAPTIVSSLLTSTSNIAAWGDSFTDANFGRYPSNFVATQWLHREQPRCWRANIYPDQSPHASRRAKAHLAFYYLGRPQRPTGATGSDGSQHRGHGCEPDAQ